MLYTLNMQRIHLIGATVLGGACVALAALYLSVPSNAYQISKETLLQNCRNFTPGSYEESDAVIDIANGITIVRGHNSASSQASAALVEVELPFKKNISSFEYRGCTLAARKIMDSLQADYDQYITESCKDFRNVLSGRKPLPIRNGRKAQIEGARQFVSKYCR